MGMHNGSLRITLTGYGGMVWGLLDPDTDELTTSIRNNQATCGPCIVMFGLIGRMADWHAVGIAISDLTERIITIADSGQR